VDFETDDYLEWSCALFESGLNRFSGAWQVTRTMTGLYPSMDLAAQALDRDLADWAGQILRRGAGPSRERQRVS
jgi:hypothetical protein